MAKPQQMKQKKQQQKPKQKKQKSQASAPKRGRKSKVDKSGERAVVDMRRPWQVDAVKSYATTLAQSMKEGGKAPLPPRNGILSATAFEKMENAYDEAVESGSKLPSMPNLYQPPVIDGIKLVNARAAQRSHAKSKPKEWSDGLGDWEEGFGLGDIRSHHAEDARKLVTDPEENVIKVGAWEYVVGTAEVAAIHLINASKVGSFGAILAEGKKLAAEGIKGLDNLVGRFNKDVTVEKLEDGSEIVWLPNQQVTWGYLVKGDRKMTVAQIRNLEGDASGVKFEALDAPIRLNNVSLKALFGAVKKSMSLASTKDEDGKTAWERFSEREARSDGERSVETAIATNVGTLCRLSPKVLRCQGFKSLQIGLPIFHCFEGDTVEKAEVVIGFAVGCRLPTAYAENKWAMRARLGVDEEETPKEKAKPKAAKSKSKPKKETKKPKAKKAKKSKAVSEAAAEAVVDTADQPPVDEVEDDEDEIEVEEEDEGVEEEAAAD